MPRPPCEVADVFRSYGEAYRQARSASMPQSHLRVMRAIETCRTAELGGHVDACTHCGAQEISYNSCRNRHCPKCQSAAKARWLEARQAELLPVGYFHVVFTLPEEIAQIGLQNKRLIYDLLFKATAETLRTVAANPKYLGADIGFLAVLHTWGQALTFHPHLHCVVPAGGLDPAKQWISCRPNFFLPVRVLSRHFRKIFLRELRAAYQKGQLQFFGDLAELAEPRGFADLVKRARRPNWVVYAKKPFGGPKQVLDYLGRYTHRVAISNHRILNTDNGQVTFNWRNYRHGNQNQQMTLTAKEFIRRFLLHVLPDGFVRIRHFGILSNRCRRKNIEQIRLLLQPANDETEATAVEVRESLEPRRCPQCGLGYLVYVDSSNLAIPKTTPEGNDSS